MDVLWLGLSLFFFVSKHNMLKYYGWVCRCCRRSVNTMHGQTGKLVGFFVAIRQYRLCGRIMVGFIVVFVRQ